MVSSRLGDPAPTMALLQCSPFINGIYPSETIATRARLDRPFVPIALEQRYYLFAQPFVLKTHGHPVQIVVARYTKEFSWHSPSDVLQQSLAPCSADGALNAVSNDTHASSNSNSCSVPLLHG
ncbi:hypothetical protein KP509_37G007700 [Ceratopteris richardii]|uniref:Uncharacterized protein n=1 Tax=Ceratopteris richardii TaxID=49495 RepID=A0A8T2Q5W8_CERRI|nr:hypothetical protein KP509_37G007700 [Ceratopteris richardii]